MKAFQAGMHHFQETGAKVFAISTDDLPSQKAFAEKLGLSFPLLSDFVNRHVSKEYGVLLPKYGVAQRVTFVIDRKGRIYSMESKGDALKLLHTPDACSRLAHERAKG